MGVVDQIRAEDRAMRLLETYFPVINVGGKRYVHVKDRRGRWWAVSDCSLLRWCGREGTYGLWTAHCCRPRMWVPEGDAILAKALMIQKARWWTRKLLAPPITKDKRRSTRVPFPPGE